MQPISIAHVSSITTTAADLREHHCVYSHHIISNDGSEQLFWIGHCKLYDVFKHPDAHRNSLWRETVRDATKIKTTIIFSSASIPECNKFLSQIVAQTHPIANKRGIAVVGPVIISCIEGEMMGQYWRNQVEAARACGIHQPTLSNHLNGTPGYERIRGMKFKRGMP